MLQREAKGGRLEIKKQPQGGGHDLLFDHGPPPAQRGGGMPEGGAEGRRGDKGAEADRAGRERGKRTQSHGWRKKAKKQPHPAAQWIWKRRSEPAP